MAKQSHDWGRRTGNPVPVDEIAELLAASSRLLPPTHAIRRETTVRDVVSGRFSGAACNVVLLDDTWGLNRHCASWGQTKHTDAHAVTLRCIRWAEGRTLDDCATSTATFSHASLEITPANTRQFVLHEVASAVEGLRDTAARGNFVLHRMLLPSARPPTRSNTRTTAAAAGAAAADAPTDGAADALPCDRSDLRARPARPVSSEGLDWALAGLETPRSGGEGGGGGGSGDHGARRGTRSGARQAPLKGAGGTWALGVNALSVDYVHPVLVRDIIGLNAWRHGMVHPEPRQLCCWGLPCCVPLPARVGGQGGEAEVTSGLEAAFLEAGLAAEPP